MDNAQANPLSVQRNVILGLLLALKRGDSRLAHILSF
jgi:hypothetical protein